eukprot:g33297.t1
MVVVTHWADIKGYLVPELILQRLMAWEGRTIVSGRRLNDIQLQEVRKKLRTLVRKHSAGFVKGELWPSWPAEAELGIDKQVRGRDDGALQEQGAPRRRSRSRSQSLARAMKEEDEVKKAADREAVVDCDPDEVTGDNIIEAYATATGSGQTHQEAIDTVQMIYEVDVSAIKNVLKSYIKKNCGKQNEQAHEQDSDVWPESYCYSLWELLAPRKSKGLEGSKDLKGKTLFDKGVMMEAPQKQVEKVGYNEVKYALGIFGDEGRKEHGYDTKNTLTEDVEDISSRFEGPLLKMAQVDVTDLPDAARDYRVDAVPYFLVLRDGHVIEEEQQVTGDDLARLKLDTEEWCRAERLKIENEWKRLDRLRERMSDLLAEALSLRQFVFGNCLRSAHSTSLKLSGDIVEAWRVVV